MRVVVPFVGEPDPEVDGALIAACADGGHDHEWWNVSRSDRAYYDALAGWWAYGETFCIVEHDIVVYPTTVAALAHCPHDWCAFPFDYMCGITPGLGCAKFSADLIARNPNAMARVGVMSDGVHPKRHWCRLDAWLTTVLEQAGERRHVHPTVVRHLDTGCSHGCC